MAPNALDGGGWEGGDAQGLLVPDVLPQLMDVVDDDEGWRGEIEVDGVALGWRGWEN